MPTLRSQRILAAVLLFGSALSAQQPANLHPIQIENGKLLGVLTPDRKVVAYKGIPYAQPPVEDLRWRPPQPIGKWKKVLFARDFGAHCLQSGSSPDMTFRDSGASEDCLTLNVWAPYSASPDRKAAALPVMVWIHGGAFTTGGTSEARQDGQFLAHRNVIVVSMNYRLGIFGFFTHPELTAESTKQSSGNYGLMDQAAALAWVRRNIAAFGGDPANITLFGESAGSMSVSAQMASPVSNTLFAKAIGESGSEFPAFGSAMPTLQQAQQTNVAWAERAFGTSKLFFLRLLPAQELLDAAMSRTNSAPRFGPVVDGFFLPDSVPRIFAAGKQAHIPLLAGWNANKSRPATPTTADSFTVQAHVQFGPDALKFLALYPASTDAEAAQSAEDYASDQDAFPTWAWIEAQTKTGNAPAYRYFFSPASPADRNHSTAFGTFPSDDIEYVFGTLDSRPEMKVRPEDRQTSDLMQQYWTNFAKYGNPNGAPSSTSANPALPQWPIYTPATNYQVMHLDATPTASPDTLRPRDLFLEQFWSKPAPPQ